MTVLDKLATSFNRRDEVPNQELAQQITKTNDKKAVKELVDNLANKSKDIQSDCIKVIYEIGWLKPALIAEYASTFLALLDSKNNRLQWGAMMALNAVTPENPKLIYHSLSKIITVAEKGSVITKDHAVNILIKLCAVKAYAETAFSLLNQQLLGCPSNQLAMYAERSIPAINTGNKNIFIKTLHSRLDDIEKETIKKRVEKVIVKFSR